MTKNSLKHFLEDSFLATLMEEIKVAGPIKSSLLDITHKCNLRCDGCYYFAENMDRHQRVDSEVEFDAFLAAEKARGINMFTVVGGEPALELERLRKMAKLFQLTVVTNGSIPIPMDGLENIRIAVSFWGDEQQDVLLRGNGKKNIFNKALQHFQNDPRAGFYYTTVPGFTEHIEEAVDKMVANGNFVAFNFYGDVGYKGGAYAQTHTQEVSEVNRVILRLTNKYPQKVISSPYINQVIHQRHLFGQAWGFDVCPSVTFDHPENAERIKNGKSYPVQFRAYNADLKSTRRCCIGEARDCDTCTDLWATYGWVIGSMRQHLSHINYFSAWLFTTYLFYASTGMINCHHAAQHHLIEIYKRFDLMTFNSDVTTETTETKDVTFKNDDVGVPDKLTQKRFPIFRLETINA